jgi:hypothetical protein
MSKRFARLGAMSRLAALIMLAILFLGFRGSGMPQSQAPAPLPDRVIALEPGWSLTVQRTFSERVTALAIAGPDVRREAHLEGVVFVGTGGPNGTVLRYQSRLPQGEILIGEGLGDHLNFGVCAVNHLEVRDIDRNGPPELLAQTCQISPMGRPRLYVWDIGFPPALRSVVRPEIASSWSHGLAFFPPSSGLGPTRIFSTFCGHGEVVEFRLDEGARRDGFRREAITWKQASQLPASGEQAESADLDRDGVPELVLAAGFAPNAAAIHVMNVGAGRERASTRFVVEEGRRFGNVRFLIGDLVGDGSREMIAWWCQDLAGGPCEMIRYRFGPDGVLDRNLLGVGVGLWPDDGQAVLADAEGNDRPLVWFVSRDGGLWTYDPSGPARIHRLGRLAGPIGPLSPYTDGLGPGLLIGWGNSVVRLTRERPDPASSAGPIATHAE